MRKEREEEEERGGGGGGERGRRRRREGEKYTKHRMSFSCVIHCHCNAKSQWFWSNYILIIQQILQS